MRIRCSTPGNRRAQILRTLQSPTGSVPRNLRQMWRTGKPCQALSPGHINCRVRPTHLVEDLGQTSCQRMKIGLLLLAQEDFQQALQKELTRPCPFVCRHPVPFFTALPVDAEVGAKDGSFSRENLSDRGIFFA